MAKTKKGHGNAVVVVVIISVCVNLYRTIKKVTLQTQARMKIL